MPRHARVGDHRRRRAPGRWGRAARRAGTTRVQSRPTIQCAATATIAAGDRHRRARACAAAGATRAGASRPRPRARRGTGSRSARRPRGRATKPERGVEVEHLQPAVAEHEAGDARTAPRATGTSAATSPATSAPHHQQRRRGRAARSSRLTGLESASESTEGEGLTDVRITVLGKSPSWQDADGACSGYLVEEDGVRLLLDCGNGVFAKLRALRRLRRRRRGRHLAPARRPLPRPRAVLLRADLRAAPAARAGRRLAGHRPPRPARAARRRRARRELLPPRRRRLGQRGPDRERVRRCASTTPATTLEVGPLRVRFQPVPHFIADATRSRSPRQRRRAHHLRRRLRARTTSSSSSRAAPTCC